MKLIVDLIYQSGFAGMRYSISNTAEYGDYNTGHRLITDATKAEMKQVLAEIQDGTFARKWLKENADGRPLFNKQREEAKAHQVETVGAELRAKMNWNK